MASWLPRLCPKLLSWLYVLLSTGCMSYVARVGSGQMEQMEYTVRMDRDDKHHRDE